ncbi:hypothetical protein JHU38_08255 [Prevotella sp. A2931]|uniref:Uncharacterized protein n=1 Tax=Prevotella illustrans TaxID=2800387 RepID=A0ABS3M6G4_9BACT|nr:MULTISPECIES: DUF1302 family protein [Prevotella]MBO1363758.1 hypothetical protein [Prevotella illustrans]PTL26246.1 hypothetical protein C3V39_03760 [Prevotella sp. oral taxon 820]
MKRLRLWILLLVPLLSARARAQTDTLLQTTADMERQAIEREASDASDDPSLQVRVKGFLDTYHAVRTEGKADWMASRTRARGEVTLEKGPASLFLSLNATYNALLNDRTGLELREAYLSYAKGNVDLRVGRQIIVWGVADALCITDCVSPMDYTEFLAQDYDDIRIPVNALRVRYTWRSLTLEAVCIPVGAFGILPTDPHNPWALRPTATSLPYTIDLESGRPAKRLANMEFGGRLTLNLSGLDLSLSGLRTWNKMPVVAAHIADDGRSLRVDGLYRRMTMIGADCALPIGRFVLRGETACYFDEPQEATVDMDVLRSNVLHALIGIDWFPGHDWNVSAQYAHRHLTGRPDNATVYRNTGLATARIGKELLRNTLKLSTFAYIDVTNGGVFNRFSAAYALNDQIELTAGYDFFHADKGKFAAYGKNSEAWVKLKYSF